MSLDRRPTQLDDENDFEFKQKWIYDQMKSRIPQFSNKKKLEVFCGTWNVNDKIYSDGESKLRDWIYPNENASAADIFAIGLQEVVDLNTMNVVISNQKAVERKVYWQSLIEDALNSIDNGCYEYTLIFQKHLVGLMLLIYVKKIHLNYIRDVWGTVLPTGILGIMGNKGAVCVRIDVNMTSICFVCSHFHAGRENVAIRNNDFHNVMNKVTFLPGMESAEFKNDSRLSSRRPGPLWVDAYKKKEYFVNDHDIIFWLGDLNYRIDESISTEDVFQLVTSKNEYDWISLRDKDQLLIEKQKRAIFENFREGELTFSPSYKYQPGTDIYESRSDRKLRAPAWCDRILWKTENVYDDSVKLVYYRKTNLNLSDHKPVSAFFECDCRIADPDKERSTYQELLGILDRWENSAAPKLEIASGRSLDFGTIEYCQEKTMPIQIKNVGVGFAQWALVPKLDDDSVSKKWLKFHPSCGALAPGKTADITAKIFVDSEIAQDIRLQDIKTLDDIIVLRVMNGSDFFVTISAVVSDNLVTDSLMIKAAPPVQESSHQNLPTSKRSSMQFAVSDIYTSDEFERYGELDD